MKCFPTKISPNGIPFSSFPVFLTKKTVLISKASYLISFAQHHRKSKTLYLLSSTAG